jgi:hypothetical protein
MSIMFQQDWHILSMILDFRGLPVGSPCHVRQASHSPAPLILCWAPAELPRQATRDSGCGVPEPSICVLTVCSGRQYGRARICHYVLLWISRTIFKIIEV